MILTQLVQATQKRVAEEKRQLPLAALQAQVATLKPRGLQPLTERLTEHFGLIAELKQASPSKGVMVTDFPVKRIAEDYLTAGADALSVLTEPDYFHGDLDKLATVASISDKPVLRKDFIIDPYMIYQAKLAGADIILLIVAILTDDQLREYAKLAKQLGLEAIVECHDQQEVARALAIAPAIIGVNNRNLQDFSVDVTRSQALRQLIPEGVMVIAESGMHTPAQLLTQKQAGLNGALIGESLMRAKDRQATLAAFKAVVA